MTTYEFVEKSALAKPYPVEEEVEREWSCKGWDTDHPSVRSAVATAAFRRCDHEDTVITSYARTTRQRSNVPVYVKRCKECGGYASPAYRAREATQLDIQMNSRGHVVGGRS
jgi:hypothetical protein